MWSYVDHRRSWELGFALLSEYAGKGYGSEATRLLLQFAFQELQAHKVVGMCNSQNVRSAALMQHVRMTREAVFKEELWWNNEWTDQHFFSILDKEFIEQTGGTKVTKLVLLSDLYFESNDELDQRILSLFDSEQPSIGYIPSCSDLERKYFEHTRRYYNRLGIDTMYYYDLDTEYEESIFGSIFECDAIHLSGGNTFYFLSVLQKRNALGLLRSYVKRGGILIGVSAGSILTTPTIKIAGYGKDADENNVGLNDMKALGLVDFEFAPHWDGSEDTLNSLREYTRVNRMAVYACEDGGGVVIDGESVELYGNVRLIDYREWVC